MKDNLRNINKDIEKIPVLVDNINAELYNCENIHMQSIGETGIIKKSTISKKTKTNNGLSDQTSHNKNNNTANEFNDIENYENFGNGVANINKSNVNFAETQDIDLVSIVFPKEKSNNIEIPAAVKDMFKEANDENQSGHILKKKTKMPSMRKQVISPNPGQKGLANSMLHVIFFYNKKIREFQEKIN